MRKEKLIKKKEETIEKINYILKSDFKSDQFHNSINSLINDIICKSLNIIIKDFISKCNYKIISDDGNIGVMSSAIRSNHELNYLVIVKSMEIKLDIRGNGNQKIIPKKICRYFFITPEDSMDFDSILKIFKIPIINKCVFNLAKDILTEIYSIKENA